MTVEFIIPVGTSLLTGWLMRTQPDIALPTGWLPNDSPSANEAKPPDQREWLPVLAAALRNGDRTSAELDSTNMWIQQNSEEQIERVTFLISETDECKWVASMLANAFRNHFGIATVSSVNVPQLRLDQMREGLVEFVRAGARSVKEATSRGARPIVNATPGFKAETSLLTLLGAVLGAETIYLHEKMKKVITIPAIPLRWDLQEHEVRALRSIGDVATRDDVRDNIGRQISQLLPFLERVGEGDDEIWGLSALGELVVQTTETDEIEAPPERQGACVVEVSAVNHHQPSDFDSLVKQVGDRLPFVTAVVNYEHGKSGNPGLLMPQAHDAERFHVRLRSKAADGTRVYLRLKTTAKNEAQWMIARRLTAEAFGRVSLADELAADTGTVQRCDDPLPDAAQLDIEKLLMDRAASAERARDRAHEELAELERENERLRQKIQAAEDKTKKAVNAERRAGKQDQERLQKKIDQLEDEVTKLKLKLTSDETTNK